VLPGIVRLTIRSVFLFERDPLHKRKVNVILESLLQSSWQRFFAAMCRNRPLLLSAIGYTWKCHHPLASVTTPICSKPQRPLSPVNWWIVTASYIGAASSLRRTKNFIATLIYLPKCCFGVLVIALLLVKHFDGIFIRIFEFSTAVTKVLHF